MKSYFFAIFGVTGAFLNRLFGGFDIALQSLIIVMTVDYLTGFLIAVRCKSPKTANGALSSTVGFEGLVKKIMML